MALLSCGGCPGAGKETVLQTAGWMPSIGKLLGRWRCRAQLPEGARTTNKGREVDLLRGGGRLSAREETSLVVAAGWMPGFTKILDGWCRSAQLPE